MKNIERSKQSGVRWQYIVLAALIVLSCFLYFWKLNKEGNSNEYYSAAVTSMLKSPAAFFFGGFDTGLYITVDKPPVGLWLQALSEAIFGPNSFGFIFPSALAGILCILMVFLIVKKVWGPTPGVLAAGIMAITPILVAMSRTNNMDTLLLLFLLLGAMCILKAAQKQSLPLYVLAMILIGLGFNIKMLEAYLVLPAFLIVYFMGTEKTTKKLIHTAIAVCVLVAISFSWAVAVDTIPAAERPYIGSSTNNSEMDLIFGYNGMSRLYGQQLSPRNGQNEPAPSGNLLSANTGRPGAGPGKSQESGDPGIFRLYSTQLAGLASWFLLPALCVAALAIYGFFKWIFRKRSKVLPEDKKQKLMFIVFWSAWLVPMAAFFSYGGFIHRYYVVFLIPAIAILAALAFKWAWENPHKKWMVPALFAATLAMQLLIIWGTIWTYLLLPMVVCGGAAIILYLFKRKAFRVVAAILTAGVLFAAPFTWALTPVTGMLNAPIPDAGPSMAKPFGGMGFDSGEIPVLDQFVESHYNGERWALAVPRAIDAAPVILETGLPVMAVGGYTGADQILTLETLKNYVASGELKYFMVTGFGNGGSDISQWLQQNGKEVSLSDGTDLYDLSEAKP